jgi:hypothetical protein
VQARGGPGEVQLFGQHGEITELADFHGGQLFGKDIKPDKNYIGKYRSRRPE